MSAGASAVAEVVSLHCYPVKSCRAVDLAEAEVGSAGMPHDREWMMVDARGRFVTQRTQPGLATIVPAVQAGALVLRRPGTAELRVPLAGRGAEREVEVEVWGDRALAIDAGDEAAEWCSAAVGAPTRLVRSNPARPRSANPRYAGGVHAPLRFPDGYPILLISEESLAELNSRLERVLPMNRFRPNVVIRGAGAFAEDSLTELTAGGLMIRPVKPCTRCRITQTDQLSGLVGEDEEPLRTLRSYRWDRTLHGVTFGQNCVVAASAGGTLRVGDRFSLR